MNGYFDSIIGNKANIERLSLNIQGGAISHAFIFEGARGSGKHTLARSLAAAISCRGDGKTVPCGRCLNCQKILADKSPDIITVGLEEDRVTIGVEASRFIKSDICTAPNSLPIKMYILEDADKLTEQAQNALLLSLEEPPEYIVFVLLCSDSATLLETIKSRAPIIRMERLSPHDIEAFLLKNHKKAADIKNANPEEFAEIIAASQGTLGRAVALLGEKERKKEFALRAIAKEFITLSLERSRVRLFDMIASLGSKRNEIRERLSVIQSALRDLIILKETDSPELIFYGDIEAAQELCAKFTLKRLMDMYSAVGCAIDDLASSANVRLTLLYMVYNAGLAD